jgi:hypothetical protein
MVIINNFREFLCHEYVIDCEKKNNNETFNEISMFSENSHNLLVINALEFNQNHNVEHK